MALRNLKILDFSTLLPGPYASMVLADMGADIIKISGKNRPDMVLEGGRIIEGTDRTANQAWINRNKKTMFLDLKKPESIDIIKKLIVEGGYNIILEQFRSGVMDRLGLGYENLKELTDELIYCSLTGFGQKGIYSKRAGHDINFMALSGVMSHSGRKNSIPPLMGVEISDYAVAAMHSIIGILMAVEHRHNTGKGQHIDISILDGMLSLNSMNGCQFLAGAAMPSSESMDYNGATLYDYYETKDGKYISVAALEEKFWEKFCIAIDRKTWINDGMMGDKISKDDDRAFDLAAFIKNRKQELIKIIQSKTRNEWEKVFFGLDICVDPVLDVKEALIDSPHAKERGIIVDVDVDGVKVKQYAMPIQFSDSKPKYKFGGKKLGVDTEDILHQIGYDSDQYEQMKKDGVFGK